jgi:hypothetical protein
MNPIMCHVQITTLTETRAIGGGPLVVFNCISTKNSDIIECSETSSRKNPAGFEPKQGKKSVLLRPKRKILHQ